MSFPTDVIVNSCPASVEIAFTPPSAECTHTDDEDRALTGTWVMDEVRMAVQKGYRIHEIHEVYENQVTQYNRETGEGGFS